MRAQFREQRPAAFVASTRGVEDFVGILALHGVPLHLRAGAQSNASQMRSRRDTGRACLGGPVFLCAFDLIEPGQERRFYNGGLSPNFKLP